MDKVALFGKAAFRLTTALCLLLVGCSFQPSRIDPASANLPPFIPPTLSIIIPVDVKALTPTPGQVTAPTQSNCADDLTWLSDLSYPDGVQVKRNSILQKQWLVLNSGSCIWSEGYQIRLTSGVPMNANSTQPLVNATPGSEATITITFVSPSEPGIYRSGWQAFNPANQPFGDPVFIEIVIVDTP